MIAVVCVGVLAAAGTALWLWQGVASLANPVALEEPMLFEVPRGTAFGSVAQQMETSGLVERSLWVRLQGRLYPEQTAIKAGTYEFTDGMSPREMIARMVAGETKHWSIQFIEGWTFNDMRTALAASPRLEQVTADWSAEQIMTELGAAGEHPEGRFFPDTYLFNSKESDLDLLKRAFRKMETTLAEEWENRAENLPYANAYEALIMASIVERETGVAYEREQVAGVFVRRLQKGIRLQTDPTVIYGMGDRYKGKIGSRDLRAYTPTTPTGLMDCRRHRLPCRGARRFMRHCIPTTVTPCTLSPGVTVPTSFPARWPSTSARYGNSSLTGAPITGRRRRRRKRRLRNECRPRARGSWPVHYP